MFLNKKMGGIGNSNFGFNGSSSGGGGGGTIGGGGTLNYICKYTPNGTNIGNSLLYDNGTSVGLGTAIPDASAILELSSTTQGFATPRMTTLQRDAIATPVIGLLIYNTSSSFFNYWDGVAWIQMDTSTGGDVSGSGTTNYAVKWTDGANSVIGDGTWAFSGNDYYPVTTGSNIGDATHRIGTVFMASVFDYANDLTFFNGTSTTATLTTGGKFGIGTTPSAMMDIKPSGSGTVGVNINTSSVQDAILTFGINNNNYGGTNFRAKIYVASVGQETLNFYTLNNDTVFWNGIGAVQSKTLTLFTDTTAKFENNLGVGVTAVSNTRLHVKGIDATSANYALKIDNSASSSILYVRNDGNVYSHGVGGIVTNTAFGLNSLLSNITGSDNTVYGVNAMRSNTTGTNNTAIGNTALYNNNGSFNTATGYISLESNTGDRNTAFGYGSLSVNTTGIRNTAIGMFAGNVNAVGDNNVFIGYGANSLVNNLTNAIAIGYNAIVSASNSMVLGEGVNVGIGIPSPIAKLHIKGVDATSSNYAFKADNSASSPLLYVRNDAKVSIGKATTLTTLDILGDTTNTLFKLNNANFAFADKLRIDNDGSFYSGSINAFGGFGVGTYTTDQLNYTFNTSFSTYLAFTNAGGAGNKTSYGIIGGAIGSSDSDYRLVILNSDTSTISGSGLKVLSTGASVGNDGFDYYNYGVNINSSGIFTNSGSGTSYKIGLNVNVSNGEVNYAALFNGGNVGIGITTPTATIHAKGIDVTSSNYSLKVENSSSSPLLYAANNGSISMNGGIDPLYTLTIGSKSTGAIRMYNSIFANMLTVGDNSFYNFSGATRIGIRAAASSTITLFIESFSALNTDYSLSISSVNSLSTLFYVRNDGVSYFGGNTVVNTNGDGGLISNCTFGIVNNRTNAFSIYSAIYVPLLNVTSSGNVVIGDTLTPTARLYVKGENSTSANYALTIDNSALNPLFYVRNDGDVTIGKTLRVRRYSFSPNSAFWMEANAIEDTEMNTLNADLVFKTKYSGGVNLESIRFTKEGIIKVADDNYLTLGAFDSVTNKYGYLSSASNTTAGVGLKLEVCQVGNTTGMTAMQIEAGGNIGIGTSSPTSKLDVNGQIVAGLGGGVVTSNDSPFYAVRTNAGNPNYYTGYQFAFEVGGGIWGIGMNYVNNEYQLLASGGTTAKFIFGSGTPTTPNGKFLMDMANGYFGANITSPTATIHAKGIDATSGNYALKIDNSASSALLYVRNDGNVGIGTSSPLSKLYVNSSIQNEQIVLNNDDITGSSYFGLAQSGGIKAGMILLNSNHPFIPKTLIVRNLWDNGGIRINGGSGDTNIMYFDTTLLNVGIGTTAPNASALLDLNSTTGSLLVPRMTTTQKNALTPTNGMILYDTTLDKFQGYEAGAWVNLI